MIKQPFVYVAGPISTGGDIPGNTHRGIKLAEEIRQLGFATFCPHLSVATEMVCGASTWQSWLDYDEQIILRCDAVFRMDGDSRGADRETAFAEHHAIPVFRDLQSMISWRDGGAWRGFAHRGVLEPDHEKRTLDALQFEVGSWGDRTFPASRVESVLAHFQKEVKELVESRDPEELADCILLLIHFAHKKGVSLRDAVRAKFEINKRRKWGKPDAQGVVEHVREESPRG